MDYSKGIQLLAQRLLLGNGSIISIVFDFIVQKLQAPRKPKMNIHILQQSVLLKYMYSISFFKDHGKEVYIEVCSAYIYTMSLKKPTTTCCKAETKVVEVQN
ncbi:unnamed protein product [Linum trigynum]|uniref:Uncharacterized protein n=1 Tax=Linum trigynum TaxID=586398 RepID=A0AAV2E1A6_9ROSI